jgi:hypothetical protein
MPPAISWRGQKKEKQNKTSKQKKIYDAPITLFILEIDFSKIHFNESMIYIQNLARIKKNS